MPLAETVAAFEALQARRQDTRLGRVEFRCVPTCEELLALPAGGDDCATNQVLYNLGARGVEWDLVPVCRARARR